MDNITPYHKIDSRIMQFDFNDIEFKFGIWITKKEFGQRLNDRKPLPKGQFYMSVRVVAKDIDTTEKIARRLIKQFMNLEIIRLISSSKSPKEGSIYEYLVQVEKGTVEDTVKARLGHSRNEENQGFEDGEGHSKGTVEGTVKGTSKKKSKRKENINTLSPEEIEDIWVLYPNKKGKARAVKQITKLLKRFSKDEIIRAVQRYADEVKNTDKQYIKHGDTFFNEAIEDYLDNNYQGEENSSRKNETQVIASNFLESLYE